MTRLSTVETSSQPTSQPTSVVPRARLQRKCACASSAPGSGACSACGGRKPAMGVVRDGTAVPQSVAEVLRSPGRPLDESARATMESRFGHHFGDVRVHDDGRAALSAGDVAARAYTVGNHVVLGDGRPAAGSPDADRLLAHELTHVVQQRGAVGGAPADSARMEAEARHAERGVGPVTALSPTPTTLARDEDPQAAADAGFEATLAEGTCDIGALCRLSFRAPEVVSSARVLRAFRACHPEISPVSLVGGNPCLTPNFGLPSLASPAAAGPRRAPAGGMVGPQPAPASASGSGSGGSGLSLPSTNIRFSLGPVAFNVDLPASLTVRLPVPFRGAQRVVFQMNASPSEFSFQVTINAVRHVRIIARGAATTEGRGSAQLTVQTTRTVCRAMSPAASQAALTSAGERLRDAIRAVQSPPPVAEDASDLERTFAPHARYGEVVAAIANVHSTIERVRGRCREVPVASFSFGAEGPLTTPEPGSETEGSYVGGTLRFHF